MATAQSLSLSGPDFSSLKISTPTCLIKHLVNHQIFKYLNILLYKLLASTWVTTMAKWYYNYYTLVVCMVRITYLFFNSFLPLFLFNWMDFFWVLINAIKCFGVNWEKYLMAEEDGNKKIHIIEMIFFSYRIYQILL